MDYTSAVAKSTSRAHELQPTDAGFYLQLGASSQRPATRARRCSPSPAFLSSTPNSPDAAQVKVAPRPAHGDGHTVAQRHAMTAHHASVLRHEMSKNVIDQFTVTNARCVRRARPRIVSSPARSTSTRRRVQGRPHRPHRRGRRPTSSSTSQRVTFIDSTALGVLIGGVERLHAVDGRLALVATSRPVVRILTITGLDRVLTIFDTRERAVARRAAPERRAAHASSRRPGFAPVVLYTCHRSGGRTAPHSTSRYGPCETHRHRERLGRAEDRPDPRRPRRRQRTRPRPPEGQVVRVRLRTAPPAVAVGLRGHVMETIFPNTYRRWSLKYLTT